MIKRKNPLQTGRPGSQIGDPVCLKGGERMKDIEIIITKIDGTRVIVKIEDDKEVVEIQEKKRMELKTGQ